MSSNQHDLPRESKALHDDELVAQARAMLPPVDAEPRPGFAARVAANAAEHRARRFWARPLARWTITGAALTATAAALLFVTLPHTTSHPAQLPEEFASNDRADPMLHAASSDLALAQRLELYEDLALVQNEDALEEMDVVARLHQLHREVKP